MSIFETQCSYQGKAFFRLFEVAGLGKTEVVNVRYNGDELQALTGGLPAASVATTLLCDLVIRKTIAEKVATGNRGGRAINPDQSR